MKDREVEALPLGQALRKVWAEMRTPPSDPAADATPQQLLSHIGWSTLAAALTWRGAAFMAAYFAAVLTVLALVGYDLT